MTKIEFMKRYALCMFFFHSYHKYQFTVSYFDPDSGNQSFITFGGNSHEIYRFEINDNSAIYVEHINNLFEDWSFRVQTEWGDVIAEG